MKNLFNCDGRRFSAKIDEIYCEGVITVQDDQIYLCQNIKNGFDCKDKKGFKFSWLYEDRNGEVSGAVTDFRLLEEEPQEGDWVYVSNFDPECKEQVERLFLYRTKTGMIICVVGGEEESYLHKRLADVMSWKYMKPIPKEVITEVTTKEALEIIAKQKGISVENLRIKK